MFIFRTQIKMFLIKSETLTLHRQQHNWNVPRSRNEVNTSVKQSMWHQWLNLNFATLREYLFFCAKKTKNNNLLNHSSPWVKSSTILESEIALFFFLCVFKNMKRMAMEWKVQEMTAVKHVRWVCLHRKNYGKAAQWIRFCVNCHLTWCGTTPFTLNVTVDIIKRCLDETFNSVPDKMIFTYLYNYIYILIKNV